MSRASQPQHTLVLITLSPSTMPRERSSFELVNWPTERKNRAKTNTCSFVGMEKWLPALAIATSWGATYLLSQITSVPWPFAAPGPGQGLGLPWPGPWRTLTLKHQFTCHNYTSMKSPDKDIRSCWLLGSKWKTSIFLFPLLRRSFDACS